VVTLFVYKEGEVVSAHGKELLFQQHRGQAIPDTVGVRDPSRVAVVRVLKYMYNVINRTYANIAYLTL